MTTLGVDYGWTRLPDGGSVYTIQLNRQTLDALRDGQPIESDVMPEAGAVRSFRIVVGDEKLAREKPPEKPAAPSVVAGPPHLPPNPLLSNPTVKPLTASQATYAQTERKPPTEEPTPAPASKAAPDQPAKPWLPFTLTVMGLFASLGANVYLGWISWGLRKRCRRELAAESSEADSDS